MSNESTKTNQITEGVIWKQLLIFFFPIVVGTLFQQLYNTVDAVIVGRFVGKGALAAVGGSSAVLSNLIIGCFTGLASGASVIVFPSFMVQRMSGICKRVCIPLMLFPLSSVLYLQYSDGP